MKKKLLTMSVVALLASMMFGTVALASDTEEVATGTDAVIEVAADEDTTEIEAVDDAVEVETVDAVEVEEVTEEVEENEIDINKGWVQRGSDWYFYNDKGVMATTWKYIKDSWYYFDATGVMQTGWQKIDGSWYYFDADGIMQTGWKQIGKYWYVFDSKGAMQTGWIKEGGYWYYLSSEGKMQTGWTKIGSAWYHFTPGGKLQTGWHQIDGSWYYFGTDGKMCTGWQQISGKWYYFKDGAMVSGVITTIHGKEYKFNKDGSLYTGWYSWTFAGKKVWAYYDTDGLASGWKKIDGSWYYFATFGIMLSGGSYTIDGTLQFFASNGKYEGTNSRDNHCQVNEVSRDYRDYGNGEVWIRAIDAYYNGKNQLVLDAVVANRAGDKIQLYDCRIVVYDSNGNVIAEQTFDRSDFTCANNTVKDISFTFNKSKIVDLRYGANVETKCRYYLYY